MEMLGTIYSATSVYTSVEITRSNPALFPALFDVFAEVFVVRVPGPILAVQALFKILTGRAAPCQPVYSW